MNRTLFWAPRVLCLLFIAFVSMFALDVFGEAHSFGQLLIALTMHLIPTFVLVTFLVIAWRWEWFGAVAFTACAVFFMVMVRAGLGGKLLFAVPCLVTAWLFLMNWRKRMEHRAAH